MNIPKSISNIFILIIFCLMTVLYGCSTNQKVGHQPSAPSIDCEVTSGPNKGKKGKRTEDGWCEGDWGGTECKPRSKCKDIPAEVVDITGGSGPAGGVVIGGGNPIVGIVPPHGSLPNEYCQRDGLNLSVIFSNTGDLHSPDRTTNVIVEFNTGSTNTTETQLMPSIPAGGIIEMVYEMPSQCFHPDCYFQIKWSNQPTVFGHCIG
ncbi:MAG: hypothetical protein AB2735_14365 [Candidatus Thiodiazotropha taylori]